MGEYTYMLHRSRPYAMDKTDTARVLFKDRG